MAISKRQKIGVVIIVISCIAGVAVQLATGDLVSITRTGTGIGFVIGVHDIAFVFAALALIGLACLIIPSRGKTNA